MIFFSLFCIAAASAALASAASRDMRGLSRLLNGTLAGRATFPSEGIHGVNLGSWLVFEPYMAIDEWRAMGGDWICDDCTQCINDEYRLTAKLGQSTANLVFANHWATFITQSDVDLMQSYGINSVRIPIGFWIIESTVNADETYPQGVWTILSRKGCAMLKNAGISVLLDFHAAPGVQTRSSTFTGHCVSSPKFWSQANFDRLAAAAAALSKIVHEEPQNFGTVWGIEALNEPPTDGSQTPGYNKFMHKFVSAVRNTESSLGVPNASQLSVVFMDISWQGQDNAGNPASATNGDGVYDSHLYHSFGAPCGPKGCAQAALSSHVSFACSGGGGRIASDASQYSIPFRHVVESAPEPVTPFDPDSPSFLGEWWLKPMDGTFEYSDKDSVRAFGDAQKRGYSPEGGNGGFGWYFWSWKMTNRDSDGSYHLRSYKDAVAKGYLPPKASSYYNNAICH